METNCFTMKKLTFLSLLLLLFTDVMQAQDNFANLMADLQKNNGNSKIIHMSLWLSQEFWQAVMKNQNTLSEEQRNKMAEELKPYSIFAVVEGNVNPFGEIEYESRDSIAAHIILTGSDGKTYQPIDNTTASYTIQAMTSSLGPLLTKIMGNLGKNMQIFIFNDRNPQQERVCDPYRKGIFSLKTQVSEYKWRTPLGSLLPPKICPVDQEEMNGAWDFCPWHGDKLIAK